jgi:hypothetical protein
MADRLLILFIRFPERGKVKSRLAAALGEAQTLDIYRAFVHDTITTLKQGTHSLTIAFYPGDSGEAMIDWLGKGFEYIPQRGADLGERMESAFLNAFSGGFGRVLLVGGDIPDLSAAVIEEAWAALAKNDAVIGPASDGGYYLIGFRKETFTRDIFHDIRWSTDSVFTETMTMLAKSGRRVHILPGWMDVDTVEDLRSLFLRNRHSPFRDSHTMSCCKAVFDDRQ